MLKKCHHDGLDQHDNLIKGHGIVDMDVGTNQTGLQASIAELHYEVSMMSSG